MSKSFLATQREIEQARLLEATFRDAKLTPPDEAEAVGRDIRRQRALDHLLAAGLVVKAVDRVQQRAILFHRDAIACAKAQLTKHFPQATRPESGFLAKEAGAVLGISRKFSIPLLEYLDASGFTVRHGDRRLILALSGPAEPV